jgi:hypothetical protein
VTIWELCRTVGLLTGALLATDGPLEPSYARDQGCAYACEGCRSFRLAEAGQQELRRQWRSGAKRLYRTCPFPDVVETVRQVTATQGHPRAPKGAGERLQTCPRGRSPAHRTANRSPRGWACPKTRSQRCASHGAT